MTNPEPTPGVIGFRTALLLFALLALAAFATLKGTALVIALLVVGGLAVKAYTHHLRGRIERDSSE